MPFIFNTLDEHVSVQVFGNWIKFTPGQIKSIHSDSIAKFILEKRSEDGLVDFADEMMEMDHKSPEFLAYQEQKRKEGIERVITGLERVIANLEVSLRRDLETANIKSDVLTWASKGELEAYRRLAKYKAYQKQDLANTADEIRKLKEEMNGNTVTANSGTAPARDAGSAPAKKSR